LKKLVMKLRRGLVPRQLLFLLVTALITPGARIARGQDTITLKGGAPQQVTILGVTPNGISVQMGAAQMVEPFSSVEAVTMNPPPQFTAAVAAFQHGQIDVAFSNASAVLQAYRGLPTDWMRHTMQMLGDIYLSKGYLDSAEKIYTDYRKEYPTASAQDVDVGLAGIDVAKKNYDAAKEKIDPITEAALKQKDPPPELVPLLGRAFYISGQIKEQAGDLPGALQDYLRTVAVFPQDAVAAAGAQGRADALRKNHDVTVP
jgi:tetratricopeptide (TPR) repeat protein